MWWFKRAVLLQTFPGSQAMHPAINQANELIKEYLDDDIVALTSARRGQEDYAQQNGSHVLLEGEGKKQQIVGGVSWKD